MVRRVLVVDDSATLRKLMRAVLEEAGHEVETAVDGADGLERVQQASFDLVLVDFVMPRLNGYQLTQALRSIPSLRDLPVVLVSARADQIGGRFMAQTGALAALAKPFSPSTLLSVVARALGSVESPADEDLTETGPGQSSRPSQRVGPLEVSSPDLGATWFDPAAGPPGDPPASGSPAAASTRPPVRPSWPPAAGDDAMDRAVALLVRALSPALTDLVAHVGTPTESAVEDTVRAALTPSILASLAPDATPVDASLHGPMALHGMLGVIPLGEVVQLLRLQGQTGLLVVEQAAARGQPRHPTMRVTVAFREGAIDQCVAHGLPAEFLLGRFLVADGVLSPRTLDAMLDRARERKALLGDTVVSTGAGRRADVDRALGRQTTELVYEVFRWTRGRFRFEAGARLPDAYRLRLHMHGDALLLEAYRRMDEWRLIEQAMVPARTVVERTGRGLRAAPGDGLTAEELRVLEAMDGVRTVSGVVSAAGIGTFEGCKAVHRLLRERLAVVTVP